MGYSLVQTVVPTTQPVTVAEAKLQARIDADLTDEDSLLHAYILAVTRQVEIETGRQLLQATYVYRAPCFPAGDHLPLPRPPLLGVTSVQYVDTDGATQTWASSNYRVHTQADPGELWLAYGIAWPTIRAQFDAVQITYTAGYGTTPTAVPQPLRVAILLWVAELYKHREPTGERQVYTMPYAVERLVWPYRIAEVLVG